MNQNQIVQFLFHYQKFAPSLPPIYPQSKTHKRTNKSMTPWGVDGTGVDKQYSIHQYFLYVIYKNDKNILIIITENLASTFRYRRYQRAL